VVRCSGLTVGRVFLYEKGLEQKKGVSNPIPGKERRETLEKNRGGRSSKRKKKKCKTRWEKGARGKKGSSVLKRRKLKSLSRGLAPLETCKKGKSSATLRRKGVSGTGWKGLSFRQ